MSKYIRVPLTEAMEKDYKECAEMIQAQAEQIERGSDASDGT